MSCCDSIIICLLGSARIALACAATAVAFKLAHDADTFYKDHINQYNIDTSLESYVFKFVVVPLNALGYINATRIGISVTRWFNELFYRDRLILNHLSQLVSTILNTVALALAIVLAAASLFNIELNEGVTVLQGTVGSITKEVIGSQQDVLGSLGAAYATWDTSKEFVEHLFVLVIILSVEFPVQWPLPYRPILKYEGN